MRKKNASNRTTIPSQPPEHQELYLTLKKLEARLRPHMRKRLSGRETLTQILFAPLAKMYLLGMAVGVRGGRKRARKK